MGISILFWRYCGLALGVLRVPALVYFLRMNIKAAGGINLFLSVLVGVSAYLGHSFLGNLIILVLCVVCPTIIGMYFGLVCTNC